MHDERYHYVECGLDDVYLMNGYERTQSARGTSVAIRDIDTLHRAIGEYLCRQKKDLSGKEIRFLRREMLMSQATLAHLLEVGEQTVHRWETEKNNMPKAAEALIRLLYTEQTRSGRVSIRDRLKRIADLEDEIDHTQEVIFRLTMDEKSGKSTRKSSGRWALAA